LFTISYSALIKVSLTFRNTMQSLYNAILSTLRYTAFTATERSFFVRDETTADGVLVTSHRDYIVFRIVKESLIKAE